MSLWKARVKTLLTPSQEKYFLGNYTYTVENQDYILDRPLTNSQIVLIHSKAKTSGLWLYRGKVTPGKYPIYFMRKNR